MTQLLLSDPETETVSHSDDAVVRTIPAVREALPAQDFLDALLAALTQMAVLSPRRQADVAVAMRRAGLCASLETVQGALDRLRRDGSVERPLHLSDGGILVSVTMRGIERLANTAHRHVVVAMLAPGRG
jgi:hypothetical protein